MLNENTLQIDDSVKRSINDVLSNSEYSTPEEVLKAGLELLKLHQNKVDELDKALKEGEKSGFINDFSFDDFLDKMKTIRRSNA